MKVRMVEMYYGATIVLLDEGQDFDKLYRDFYAREDFNVGLIDFMRQNGVKVLDSTMDDLQPYENQHVTTLRRKLKQYEKENQT